VVVAGGGGRARCELVQVEELTSTSSAAGSLSLSRRSHTAPLQLLHLSGKSTAGDGVGRSAGIEVALTMATP
jgi:hypothetical protein